MSETIPQLRAAIRQTIDKVHDLQQTAIDVAKYAREAVLDAQERRLTSEEIDQGCWKIWAYCRDHDSSLDSEHYCKMIRQVVLDVTGPLQRRSEVLRRQRDGFEAQLKSVRKQLREAKKEIKRLTIAVDTFGQSGDDQPHDHSADTK